jgi:hypothetical protein
MDTVFIYRHRWIHDDSVNHFSPVPIVIVCHCDIMLWYRGIKQKHYIALYIVDMDGRVER